MVCKSFFASLLVLNFGAKSTSNCENSARGSKKNKQKNKKTDHNLKVTQGRALEKYVSVSEISTAVPQTAALMSPTVPSLVRFASQ